MGKKRKGKSADGQNENNSPEKKSRIESSEQAPTPKLKVQSSKDLLMKKFNKINVLGVDKSGSKSSDPKPDVENKKSEAPVSQKKKDKNKKQKQNAENSTVTKTDTEESTTNSKKKKKKQKKENVDNIDNNEKTEEDSEEMDTTIEETKDGEEPLDPEIIKMRERKREKRRQKKLDKEKRKQEALSMSGTAGPAAIEYLKQWENDRANWKYRTVRQVWLMKNMFDSPLIDDDIFQILLRYIEPSKGKSRVECVAAAEKIINEEADKEDSDVNTIKQDRAKEIIQLLSD